MASVLHIEASPRSETSFSSRVARAFLEAYRQSHAGDWVDTMNVFTAAPPAFDAPAAEAKYAVMGGQRPTGEAGKKWLEVIETIDRFREADKLVLSVPMWNFGLPYRLKQYLDVIVQPGLTFKYDAGQYVGLVTGRPALLILSRGSTYGAGSPAAAMDMQRPYLEMILRFIGFEDIRTLIVEPTVGGGPEAAQKALDAACAEARKLATTF